MSLTPKLFRKISFVIKKRENVYEDDKSLYFNFDERKVKNKDELNNNLFNIIIKINNYLNYQKEYFKEKNDYTTVFKIIKETIIKRLTNKYFFNNLKILNIDFDENENNVFKLFEYHMIFFDKYLKEFKETKVVMDNLDIKTEEFNGISNTIIIYYNDLQNLLEEIIQQDKDYDKERNNMIKDYKEIFQKLNQMELFFNIKNKPIEINDIEKQSFTEIYRKIKQFEKMEFQYKERFNLQNINLFNSINEK